MRSAYRCLAEDRDRGVQTHTAIVANCTRRDVFLQLHAEAIMKMSQIIMYQPHAGWHCN